MSLQNYIDDAARRLGRRRHARFAAGVCGAGLAVTLAGGYLVMLTVPDASTLGVVRLLLYGVLTAALVPWVRGRSRRRVAEELERRVPDFDGRLLTWRDAARRDRGSALYRLLERQTAALADAHPPATVVAPREILIPALAAAALGVVLALLLAGSRPLQLAAQRLWTGDLLAAAQPRIEVSPGDAVVRRGSDVVINARAHGFRSTDMMLNADFGSGWERAPMTDLGDGTYGFVLVGVTGAVAYYAGERGLSSLRHRIQVADLPRLLDLDVRYRLPAWTGLEAQRQARGDLIVLPGTEVSVTALADRPLGETLLVVNGVARPMTVTGMPSDAEVDQGPEQPPSAARVPAASARGTFQVGAPGTWHVAVRHQGELARISDSYVIDLAEDAAPEVTFTWPGHDRKATPIEEVELAFQATDDYGVEALVLRYAVNGADWQEVTLLDDGHLLRLEALQAAAADGPRPLLPGDVVSFYAEARDHRQRARSALYFIDVRPFDLRYRESQQMAGQGGAEGGGFDIAERQRDILTATWNLINKHHAADREPGGPGVGTRQALVDEAEVLAMLQRTLADQVQTLIARSAARGLGRADEVSAFIGELAKALEHMQPAADRLAEQALEAAVPAEQRALTHLTTAEASVREVDVSLARNAGRGSSGRSLRELMELELDPRRNRYEMPQQPSLGEQPPEATDDTWQRLDELAARQEQLAERAMQDPASLPSRWEQARLRRELERLREQLQASAGRRGEAPQSGAPGGGLERALAEVERARRALDQDAGAEPGTRRQAAEALRRAAESLRNASRDALEQRIGRAGRAVDNLQADQQRVMEALQRLQEDALERSREGESRVRGEYRMQTFAEVKRRMQGELAELRGELVEISDAAGERGSAGAGLLDRALRELDEVRVDERLAASADAFDMGQPLYVIGSETLVEQALQRLDRRIEQAGRELLEPGRGTAQDPLADVRALRRRLGAARGADGALDADVVTDVVEELDGLARSTVDGGGGRARAGAAIGLGVDTGVYRIRGIDPDKTEALWQLTLDRLDLLEAALSGRDETPVRAERPRQPGRDSSATARYFKALSADEE